MPTVIVSTVRRVFQKLPLTVLLTGFAFVAYTQPVVNIGANFTMTKYKANSFVGLPPDANGAIGPRHFMEFINGTVALYNRTNGVIPQPKTDSKFWGDAGLIIASGWAISDPRVIYDPSVQRWFVSQVDFDGTADDPTSEANDFLLAVSTTSDPTGPWKGFLFQSDPDTGFFADFPTLGLDSNAVYIAGDFYSAGQIPEGSGFFSIPKADLLSATPTIDNRTWFGIADYDVRGQLLQPAVCVDGSVNGAVVSLSDIGNDSQPHSNVVVFAVQNAGTAPTIGPISFLDVDPWVVPDNADMGVPQFGVHQPDFSTNLLANDARICGCARAINGVIYATHQTLLNGRIAIQWYRIDGATHTLVEQGTISDPDRDLFYPSVAANPNGVVVIACDGASTTTFVSSYAYVGQTINGTTAFSAPILLKAGLSAYQGDDEQLAELIEEPPYVSRWGDYGATTVDPNDPNHFWTIQMYAQDTDVWATQVTELIVTPPNPSLSITLANNNAIVSWPSSATAFHLETTAGVSSTSWTTISQNLTTNNNQISYTTPVAAVPAFFRLKN